MTKKDRIFLIIALILPLVFIIVIIIEFLYQLNLSLLIILLITSIILLLILSILESTKTENNQKFDKNTQEQERFKKIVILIGVLEFFGIVCFFIILGIIS